MQAKDVGRLRRVLSWTWLSVMLLVAAVVAGITPVRSQSATVTTWITGVSIEDIAYDLTGDTLWIHSSDGYGLRRLDPATNQLTTWSHPRTDVFGLAATAQAVAADPTNKAWFTNNQGRINRLDAATGEVVGWPLPTSGELGYPVARASDGQIWSVSTNGSNQRAIVRLNPATNVITRWVVNADSNGIFVGPGGKVWILDWMGDEVGVLDPATNTYTEWPSPAPITTYPFGSGRIWVDGGGNAWFATYNKVFKLDPATNQMTEFTCPAGCQELVGLHLDSAGKVWLIEQRMSGSNEGIVRLDSAADPPVFTEWSTLGITSTPETIVIDNLNQAWIHYYNSSSVTRLVP